MIENFSSKKKYHFSPVLSRPRLNMLKIFHIVFYQFGAAINGIFNHNFDIKQRVSSYTYQELLNYSCSVIKSTLLWDTVRRAGDDGLSEMCDANPQKSEN